MLAQTLSRMIDEGLTSAKEVGELTGVAPSTVYRWVRGDSQPDFNSIRLLVRHLKNSAAAQSLLSAFTAGTAWNFYHARATDLDVNRDGKIGAADALDATIEAVEAAGKSLGNIRDSCRDDGLSRETAVQLIAMLNDVVRQCSITQQILVHMSERREVKENPKPPPTASR